MQQPNPYAPPTAQLQFGSNEPQRYEFDVEVLESDVHRALRRLDRCILGIILLSSMLLLTSLTIIASLRMGKSNLAILAPGLLLFLFLLVRTIWRHLGPGIGQAQVRLTPQIVGHKSGTITDSEIRISSENSTSIYPLTSCSFADVRSDTLVFAFDQQRLLLSVLPRRAFASGCFERAAKLLMLNALESKATPSAGVIDERLLRTDQSFQMEKPAEGVAFSGPITARDALSTSLKGRTTNLKRVLIGASCILILLPLSLFVLTFGTIRLEVVVAISAILVYLLFRLWRVYHANLSWTKSPDQVLMQIHGVVNDQAFHGATPTGASVSRWAMFSGATIHDNLITLALPGKLGHCVILARHQFANDNDWSKAKAIIQSKSDLFPIKS